ncbi:poly(ethylene terephthalate) hydrolase family protein [Paenibacillus apis]|uniref:Alpha/beta hydrolase n=1 Tax=Paenibacillus apis TaxID=1792174 RepID=A0A919Y2Z8_9BACL|nr:alpha/beta hydrolase [Paenibacillus apis]GIO42383.1 hypothetical protein J41TS4_21410 [Paenibacillus apis]
MELPYQTQYVIKPRRRPFRLRLRDRIRRTYQYDTAYWRLAIAGPWGAGIFAFMLAAMGMPTGFGVAFDILVFLFLGTLAHFILCHIAAFLLALLGVPGPRLYYGSLLFNIAAVYLIFYQEDQSVLISSIVTGILTVAGIVGGFIFAVLASRQVRFRTKFTISSVLVLMLLTAALWPEQAQHDMEVSADSDVVIEELTAADPSLAGSYEVHHFTYGSGKDYWQPEFGEQSDYITESVDASAYIKKWNRLRTKYWGFNEKSLPVNGRVWMPEGSGSFPLVLIVHGNHLMEDYSDDGYAYLGNLLASRGFIAVSVDENFLNYSVWTGIPDNDMKVRAWMLLKHLQQIGTFAEDAESPFYQKVNFDKIALIGHSRGGQAVAMASDYQRWFDSDPGLEGLEQYQIQAVAAIAPTDKKVDGNLAELENINYLTLQGARDGDVSDFDGERQYVRTSFTSSSGDEEYYFKAALYIGDANHSQFNTGWGRHDVSYPKGILLNRQGLLTPAEQRQIAKVYISAFLEAALHGKEQYTPLFVDSRQALDWLPETSYFNRFESSSMTAWTRFDEDANRITLPEGGTAGGEEVIWREEEAKNRRNTGKGTKGIMLERREFSDEVSTYTLDWEQGAPQPAGGIGILSFAMADRSYELDKPAKSSAEDIPPEPMEIEIELETMAGVAVSLPLSQFMVLQPLPETRFTLHPWLDLHLSDGKYKQPTESVFQTFQLNLDAFSEADSRFNPEAGIGRLSFHLYNGMGRVMIADIGVYE